MSGLIPLTSRELKKWYRNPIFLLTGLIQPFFWIALFGSALGNFGTYAGSTLGGASTYITFIMGGVLTITSLFTAMFAGTNIIFDRRLGPLGRFLSSPIRRSSIVFSKIISSTGRILIQVVILIFAALLIPKGLKFGPGFGIADTLVLVCAVVLVAFIFSSIFSIIAIRLTRMETIFGIVNLVNLPLMFASYAMFPPLLMEGWIRTVALYNPVSWSSEAIRSVVVNGTLTHSQWIQVGQWLGALAILALFLIILTFILSEKEIRD